MKTSILSGILVLFVTTLSHASLVWSDKAATIRHSYRADRLVTEYCWDESAAACIVSAEPIAKYLEKANELSGNGRDLDSVRRLPRLIRESETKIVKLTEDLEQIRPISSEAYAHVSGLLEQEKKRLRALREGLAGVVRTTGKFATDQSRLLDEMKSERDYPALPAGGQLKRWTLCERDGDLEVCHRQTVPEFTTLNKGFHQTFAQAIRAENHAVGFPMKLSNGSRLAVVTPSFRQSAANHPQLSWNAGEIISRKVIAGANLLKAYSGDGDYFRGCEHAFGPNWHTASLSELRENRSLISERLAAIDSRLVDVRWVTQDARRFVSDWVPVYFRLRDGDTMNNHLLHEFVNPKHPKVAHAMCVCSTGCEF